MEEKRNWLWFKWDIDSFDGPTSKIFLNGFIGKRAEARAAYLELITIIYKLAENGKEPWIDCSDFYYQMIAGEIDSEPTFIRQVIDRLVSIGTFETRPNPTKEGEIQVTSTRVLAEVESRDKTSEARRQAGKVGGMLKYKKSLSNEINHIEAHAKQMLANAKQVLAIGKQNLADKDKDKDKDKDPLLVNSNKEGGMGGDFDPSHFENPAGPTPEQPNKLTSPRPKPKPEAKGKYTTFDRQDFKWPPRWGNKAEAAMGEWVAYKAAAGHAKLLPSYQKEMEVYADKPQDFHALVQRAIAQGWQGLNSQIPVTPSGADQPNLGQIKPPKSVVARLFNSQLINSLKSLEDGNEAQATNDANSNFNQSNFEDVIDITENK